ncbi:glycine zipper domain-containing protein [Amaricoccus macauensis]|uniref:glycine zipper domain-containing protein n=1 Tax=Amaricoccus macauensis TaxID=57001 RepID=UPI003C7A5C6F
MWRYGIILAGAIVLSACTNADGSVNAGRTGAVLGTAGGIIVGHQVNDEIGGAVGGVLGGAAGGEVGNRIDRQ